MYFLYVDESGDTGNKTGASAYFILCGLLIHHVDRHAANEAAMGLRKRLAESFGLPSEAELHASEFLSKNSDQFGLTLDARIRCALHAIGFLEQQARILPLRAVIAKEHATAELAYGNAWKELIAMGLACMTKSDNPCTASGLIVICDDHRTAPRHELIRPILVDHPGSVIDLPFGLDSKDSHFLQLADLSAYLTKQSLVPSGTFRGRNGRPLLRRNAHLYRHLK